MTGDGADPVEAGLVESLAVPAATSRPYEPYPRTRREAAGTAQRSRSETCRVAVLYDPTAPYSGRELKEVLPDAAGALGLTLQPWEVRTAGDFEKVFAAVNKQRPDGLYVAGGGPVLVTNQKRLVGFALKSRLPSVYMSREFVDAGGLVSTGQTSGQLPARRILCGQNPKGSEACRSAGGATDEFRAGDQS